MMNVKTTLEIPDRLFRRAKATAAQKGLTLKQFVNEAVQEKLDAKKSMSAQPWMKLFGSLKGHSAELRKIDTIIEKEFEKIDPENWK